MLKIQVERYDLSLSTMFTCFGRRDPTSRRAPGLLVKAFWTPQGPCTLALRQMSREIEVEAVGDGAAWCLAWLPRMFEFAPQDFTQPCLHRNLRDLSRRLAGLRVGPVPWRFDVAMATVLQQRVTFGEAARNYRTLIEQHGLLAPGPLPLKLPLSPQQWSKLGPDRIQAEGVDLQRTRTLLRIAQLGLDVTPEKLMPLRGVGPWTVESFKGYAWGDPDALPLGDVHLPHTVCGYLIGQPWLFDDAMVALLEPYRGMRFRVISWILHGGRN